MKQHNPLRNSEGFSLVELLVSVAILGIIVLPLLGMFVTGTKTASKSRVTGEETLAAQNVAEAVQATDLGNLGSLGTVTVTNDAYNLPCKYQIQMTGVGNGKYNAQVTLTGDDQQGNTVYTPMDAVFSQESGGLDPDTTAQAQFQLEASALSANALAYDTTRAIDITINEKSGGSYEYSCKYTYNDNASYTDANGITQSAALAAVSYTYVFYDGTNTLGSSGKLASLYFFYNPFPSGTPYDDTITITRNTPNSPPGTTTPMSVFLVKQNTPDNDPNYSLLVQLKGDTGSGSKPCTSVYCNVSGATYRVFDTTGVWYENNLNFFSTLYDVEQRYRIYDMTVALQDGSGNVVYTLKGSKLN